MLSTSTVYVSSNHRDTYRIDNSKMWATESRGHFISKFWCRDKSVSSTIVRHSYKKRDTWTVSQFPHISCRQTLNPYQSTRVFFFFLHFLAVVMKLTFFLLWLPVCWSRELYPFKNNQITDSIFFGNKNDKLDIFKVFFNSLSIQHILNQTISVFQKCKIVWLEERNNLSYIFKINHKPVINC